MSHIQHPSGMPYHIYQNVVGNAKPLSDAAHRAQIAASFPTHTTAAAVLLPTSQQVNIRGLTGTAGTIQIKQEPLQPTAPSAFITMHPNANVIWPNTTVLHHQETTIDRAVAAAVSIANNAAMTNIVASTSGQQPQAQHHSQPQQQHLQTAVIGGNVVHLTQVGPGVLQAQPQQPQPQQQTQQQAPLKKKAPKKRYPSTKIHSCSFCPYTCNRPDKLRVHVMGVHNNDKPYPCEFCEKSFKQRDKLTRHTSTVHYKDKPFSCEYCQQMFGRKDKAKRHVAVVHFGEKPFRCNFCSHKTSRKDKMRIHLEQVHSKDGSEFYKLPSEEARDVKPPITLPLPLPQHPLPIEVVHSALQQSAAGSNNSS